MPNILIFSNNKLFLEDLKEQVSIYDPEYTIYDEYDGEHTYDLVVLDDREDILFNIRKHGFKIPVIYFQSGNGNVIPFISTDIILKKPINLGEFLQYLKSSVHLFDNSSEGYMVFGDYELRSAVKEVYNKKTKKTVKMTEKEVAVLKYLYKANRVVSKTELLQRVWKYSPESLTHTIETHIYRLRSKIEEENGEDQEFILTEEGGYRLCETVEIID